MNAGSLITTHYVSYRLKISKWNCCKVLATLFGIFKHDINLMKNCLSDNIIILENKNFWHLHDLDLKYAWKLQVHFNVAEGPCLKMDEEENRGKGMRVLPAENWRGRQSKGRLYWIKLYCRDVPVNFFSYKLQFSNINEYDYVLNLLEFWCRIILCFTNLGFLVCRCYHDATNDQDKFQIKLRSFK